MPELTLETLAARVAALEAKIAEMQAATPQGKDWRRTIGMFAGDEVMKEIFEAGREIREADRLGRFPDDEFMKQVDQLGKAYRRSQCMEDEG